MIEQLIDNIKEVESYEPMSEMSQTIGEWMEEVKIKANYLMQLDDSKKFYEFVLRLLAIASNEKGWWTKVRDYLYRTGDITYYNRTLIQWEVVLKKYGYRFPRKGSEVLLLALGVNPGHKRGIGWDNYFKESSDKRFTGFLDDRFLKIRGVGRKVRDLAITDFTLEYLVVDIHVKRTIHRFGYFYCKDPTGPVTKKEYDGIREICFILSKELDLFPAQFDRALWHLGRTYCKKTPLCNECPNKYICQMVDV